MSKLAALISVVHAGELLAARVAERQARIAPQPWMQRALALQADKNAADMLLPLLDSKNPSERRAAAEALAICGSPSCVPKLVAALANSKDDFEEHSCINALLVLADEPQVRGLLNHDSTKVRKAALNLLDQTPFSSLNFGDLVEVNVEVVII